MSRWLDHMLNTPMVQLAWWEMILAAFTVLGTVTIVLAFFHQIDRIIQKRLRR